MARVPSVSSALQRKLWERDQKAERRAELFAQLERVSAQHDAAIARLNAESARELPTLLLALDAGSEGTWN